MDVIGEGWIAIIASIIIVVSGVVIGYLTGVSLSDFGAVIIGILWGSIFPILVWGLDIK